MDSTCAVCTPSCRRPAIDCVVEDQLTVVCHFSSEICISMWRHYDVTPSVALRVVSTDAKKDSSSDTFLYRKLVAVIRNYQTCMCYSRYTPPHLSTGCNRCLTITQISYSVTPPIYSCRPSIYGVSTTSRCYRVSQYAHCTLSVGCLHWATICTPLMILV